LRWSIEGGIGRTGTAATSERAGRPYGRLTSRDNPRFLQHYRHEPEVRIVCLSRLGPICSES